MSFEKRNLWRRPSAPYGNATLPRTIHRDVRDRPSVVHEPYARRETTRARTERPRRYPSVYGWIGPGSQKHNPVVNVGEESNSGIVPAKLPNRAGGDTGRRGGGGKARDQGERQKVQHVPDQSGRLRVPGGLLAYAGGYVPEARLTSDAERVISEVRTVCSSSCKYGSVRGVAGNGHPYRDGCHGEHLITVRYASLCYKLS